MFNRHRPEEQRELAHPSAARTGLVSVHLPPARRPATPTAESRAPRTVLHTDASGPSLPNCVDESELPYLDASVDDAAIGLDHEPPNAHALEGEAADAAALAEATVATGSDRELIRYLLESYRDVFESEKGLAAIRTVWDAVHLMPSDDRVHLLHRMTPSLRCFPGIERSARFDEHFNAWAEVAQRHPRALQAAPAGHLSPLAMLSNLVEYLPSHCHDQARAKIGALATASLSLEAVAGPR
jgi:hypothetical protein